MDHNKLLLFIISLLIIKLSEIKSNPQKQSDQLDQSRDNLNRSIKEMPAKINSVTVLKQTQTSVTLKWNGPNIQDERLYFEVKVLTSESLPISVYTVFQNPNSSTNVFEITDLTPCISYTIFIRSCLELSSQPRCLKAARLEANTKGAVEAQELLNDEEKAKLIKQLQQETVEKIWVITSEMNVLYFANWTKSITAEMEEYNQKLIATLKGDYSDKESRNDQQKPFPGSSFFYSPTVITTIEPTTRFEISIQERTPYSVTLQWENHHCVDNSSIYSHYEIRTFSKKWIQLSTNIVLEDNNNATMNYEVTDLVPNTEYIFRVKFCRSGVNCDDGNEIKIQTIPTTIGRIHNVTILKQTKSSVTLKWNRPENIQVGKQLYYEVKVLSNKKPVTMLTLLDDSTNSSNVIEINGLSPCTSYRFYISTCIDMNGQPTCFDGTEIEADSKDSTARIKMSVPEQSVDSITLAWENPYCNSQNSSYFEIHTFSATWTPIAINFQLQDVNNNTVTHKIIGLDSDKQYYFRVRFCQVENKCDDKYEISAKTNATIFY